MGRSLAYLTLQATREGQAAHAHVHEIIAGLRAQGWSVELFEPTYPEGLRAGATARLREFRRVQRALIARLSEFDAVYVRAHPLAFQAARSARRLGVPVVQECNGPYGDFYAAWPAARFLRRPLELWQRTQYREATAVIAVTRELAEFVNREGDRSDATVVPNGANADLFRPNLQPLRGLPGRYAVFFGALSPWQGVRTILVATADPSWPADVELVIAGDGAMRAEVEAAEERGRVQYLGSLPYADTARLVSNAVVSLVVKDSAQHARSGLSPLKLYESMAAGVPVVVSDMPGLGETVRECNCGLIVPPGDSVALAAAVGSIASDSANASAMGSHARAYAERNHSWTAMALRTSGVIESAMRQG